MELPTTENRMSVAVAKTKMQLELTKVETNIQALHNLEGQLVYNEDNLPNISEFLSKVKKGRQIVDAKRKELKTPALNECRDIDGGAKIIDSELEAIEKKVGAEYTKLCIELDKRRREAENEKWRIHNIQEGIKNNILAFSTEISNATTNEQLIHVERKINLEKGRKDKYAEFMGEFIEKSKPLTTLLTEQKQKAKALEATNQELKKALETENDEKYLQLMDKRERIEAKLFENSQNVVNEALNGSINFNNGIAIVPEEVFNSIKPKRSVWCWDVSDLKETEKKMKDWVVKSINEKKVKEYLDAKKAEGIDKNVEEFVFAGVKFFLSKTY